VTDEHAPHDRAPAAPATADRSTTTQRSVLWIAVLASFVAFLDGTIVNVALPAISDELGGGITTQQWVVDAYLITLGALILVAGSVSDAYGRVLVLRIGLIGFGIASIAIAAAPSRARRAPSWCRARSHSSPRTSAARRRAGRSASGPP
jgi:MFS family permease